MNIDWSKAPEGATHYCKPHGMWHKAAYNPFRVWVWMQDAQDWELQPKERTDFWFNQGDLSEDSLLERPKKTITQDVSNRVEQLRSIESITDVARSIEAARQVEATLAERQNQYGDFKDVAHLSQGLQSLLSVGNFSDTQQEAIQMICSKLARLACGDADHVDSWHDIAGYATLVVKDLESGK